MLFRCIGFGGAFGRAPPVLETVAGMGRGIVVGCGCCEERGLANEMSFCIGGAILGWITPLAPACPTGFRVTAGLFV